MQTDSSWYEDKLYGAAKEFRKAMPDFLQLLKVQYQAIKNKAPHDTETQRAERDRILSRYDQWISDIEAMIGRFDDLEKKYLDYAIPDHTRPINGMFGWI